MIATYSLNKFFAHKQVLNNINLNFKAGERIALLGQNGSGKTTFIRCLLGLYKFDGQIMVNGIDILKNRTNALEHITFVPQLPPPIKNTIEEILFLNEHLAGINTNHVSKISEDLGLNIDKIKKQAFKNLSGGMKQKFLIACSLARNSNILIFDEPTANLDSNARTVFFEYLKKISNEKLLLLTSHRVDELSEIITRTVEFDFGEVSMDEVFSSVTMKGSTRFLFQINFFRLTPLLEAALKDLGFIKEKTNSFVWSANISNDEKFRTQSLIARYCNFIKEIKMEEISK